MVVFAYWKTAISRILVIEFTLRI